MSCERDIHNGKTSLRMSVPRRVVVKGREGVVATVVVTIHRGGVWMSIVPPFTWEAIMEPGKVDELIHVLGLAREEAMRSVTMSVAQVDCKGKRAVLEIRNPD